MLISHARSLVLEYLTNPKIQHLLRTQSHKTLIEIRGDIVNELLRMRGEPAERDEAHISNELMEYYLKFVILCQIYLNEDGATGATAH